MDDHFMPRHEEEPRLVSVKPGLVPKAANDLPGGLYARPGLVDSFPVRREQFAQSSALGT